MHIIGSKIALVTPMQGFGAETGGAITLSLAIEPGAARPASAVRWSVARGVVIAWFVAMPMAGRIAAGAYDVASLLK